MIISETLFHSELPQDRTQHKITDYAPYRISGEIIALRNLIKADKGNKASLEKPIPVAENGELLADDANELYNNIGGIFEDEKIRDLVAEGHGGRMIGCPEMIRTAFLFFASNIIKAL